MRILLDENVPRVFAAALEAAGHDVVAVEASVPGIKDQEVWSIAKKTGRICVTFDKDFGLIAKNETDRGHPGIVLIRYRPPPDRSSGTALVDLLAQTVDWTGRFAVMDRDVVRFRRFGD
jgi:predicted nuclease of predicted toxin-antitoxin system